MEHPIVDSSGQEKGALEIPEELLTAAARPYLWWQVAVGEAASRRSGTSSTKTRSEMRGGGAKPWRQKGTGRARQGSNRAPQWRGGAVSHGPRPRSYTTEVPRRQRRMAFYGLLTERLRLGETVVVDSLEVEKGKTKEMLELLDGLTARRQDYGGAPEEVKTLILLHAPDQKLVRAAGNLTKIRLRLLRGAQLSDLVWADRLIFTTPAAEEALREARKWLVKPTAS